MYGIVAIGMTFLLISGEIDLSLGMSVALSTIVSSLVGSQFGGVAGIIAAVVVCGAVGLFNGFLVTHFRMSSLIASLATMTALSGVCFLLGDGKTVPNNSELLRALYTFKLFGVRFLQLPIVLFILCLVGFGLLLHNTRFGNGIFVVGGNEEAGIYRRHQHRPDQELCFLIGRRVRRITGILLGSYVFAGLPATGKGSHHADLRLRPGRREIHRREGQCGAHTAGHRRGAHADQHHLAAVL